MLQSLRSRLVLSNLLITLLGMIVMVAVFSQLLAQRSAGLKQTQLRDDARNVAHQVELLYRSAGSTADLRREVQYASGLLGERVTIVSPIGQIIVDSAGATHFSPGEWLKPDKKALRQAQSEINKLQGSDLVRFQAPIRGTVRPNGGAVLLVAHVHEVQPNALELAQVTLVAALTALLVWIAIGLYFAFSISRPLLRITRATERMARGDYNVRVDVRGHGEIGLLAASFNEMARQVQRSNQVLRDFLANVSHDLRTPLTMIAGFSEALLDGTAGSRDREDSAAVIHEEAAKMQRLVDDLMQLTRLESGLLKLDCHPLALHPFVESLIDRLNRARADGAIPPIKNQVPPEMPQVDVDPDQLERALRNLLDNALQYTPPSGSVSVGAETVGDSWVAIAVSDTGAGIPSEDLPRIFERFYRSDKSRERTKGHSGLGLAIVREIIEAHGGVVSVDSRTGQGTTFRLTVPVAAPQSAQLAAQGAP